MDKDIKTLKRGESGYGYLIEHDAGYISPDEPRNLPFINEMKKLESGKLVIAEPLLVYVVLQKFGILNRNGRIYPESILRSQDRLYQEVIRERRAVGELDHPECHRQSAEILTKDGWKYIKDVSSNEEVYTLNPISNQIELKTITKKIVKHYNGSMISIKGRSIDLMVTPNHKFWVIDRNGNGSFITATDIHEHKIKGIDKMYIPKVGKWIGDDKKFFTIKGLDENEIAFNTSYSKKLELMSDIEIPMDLWVKFMGIYLADGCVVVSKTKKRISRVTENGEKEYGFESSDSGYVCKITQKKENGKILIRELLESLPLSFKEIIYSDGKVDFKINDARLHNYLKQFGKSQDKFIPTELKGLSDNLLSDFIDWFVLGDGRVRGGKYREVFSTSKKLINDLQEIILKIGYSSNLRIEERNYDRMFDNRVIKKGHSKPMNRLHISTTKGIYLDKRTLKTELVEYNDNVYCVDVPNHVFYVRDNGKTCWNGNSSIIAGDRISHNIVETWWEGHTLMGKMEVIMSPGFVNLGIISCKGDDVANLLRNRIKIGVSSRGVGSLKESKDGQQIVQDDYEIICWDVVTAPSTPDAWIGRNHEELKPYVESLNIKKPLLNENLLDDLDKFLSD